jgi:hypothetical protein
MPKQYLKRTFLKGYERVEIPLFAVLLGLSVLLCFYTALFLSGAFAAPHRLPGHVLAGVWVTAAGIMAAMCIWRMSRIKMKPVPVRADNPVARFSMMVQRQKH